MGFRYEFKLLDEITLLNASLRKCFSTGTRDQGAKNLCARSWES